MSLTQLQWLTKLRSTAVANQLEESWSFSFEDYAIEHQGNSVIDLTVSYDYVDGIGTNDPFEYPEFIQIYNFIDDYLVNYPNENDFWEILNKNLVDTLLSEPIPTQFGIEYNLSEVLESLTVEIDVESGSSGIDIPRSTIVTGVWQEERIDFDESWSFSFEDYAIEHQGNSVIDLTVSYDYVDGIGTNDPFEYPEFIQIYNFIDDYLVNYPNENDFWEILNKNLVDTLLSEPIPTQFGIEYNLSEVLESLTVEIDVESGSSGIDIPRSTIVTGFPQTQETTEIIGSRNNDILYGSDRDELIKGKAGNDILYGNGGKDTLVGGKGDDIIYGGLDKDIIRAGAGDDLIYANGGRDYINSGTGEDIIWLGQGSATIFLKSGKGFDTINNFQLGETKIKVNQVEDLWFADSQQGTLILREDDLLGSITSASADDIRSNLDNIFFA